MEFNNDYDRTNCGRFRKKYRESKKASSLRVKASLVNRCVSANRMDPPGDTSRGPFSQRRAFCCKQHHLLYAFSAVFCTLMKAVNKIALHPFLSIIVT